ncbi:MAG: hypothetical protein LBE17_12500 [Treponema sp.]|nr:hypothetical protein [Treponema sp.]
MRRSVFPRMVGLFFLYMGIFVILVMIQFTKQRIFIQNIGDMTVSGQYGDSPIRTADAGGESPAADYHLTGNVTVAYGGMEFHLHDDGEFAFLGYAGDREPLLPQTMNVYGSSVLFGFTNGTQLIFNVLSAEDAEGPGLRISGRFGDDYTGLELPFRLLRTSRARDAGNGQFVVNAGGMQYGIDSSRLNGDRRVLLLDTGNTVAYYRAVQEHVIPEQMGVIPENFILAAARDETQYNRVVNRWRDEAYSLWTRSVRTTDNEALVAAYAGESVNRGAYKEAMAGISSAFLRRASWTYTGSVYLGRMDIGLRSLSAFERDAANQLSLRIAAESEAVFQDPHIVEFCVIRGYDQFLDGIADLARSLDPASLPADILSGILGGYTDWKTYRSPDDNPFEGLIEGACLAIYEGIKGNAAGDRVMYFKDGTADTEYNLRLGLALDRYGRISGREEWSALGRSLVISVLSLTDNGSLPTGLAIPGTAESGDEEGIQDARPISDRGRLECLALYPLFPAATYPHAVSIGNTGSGVWAWTASESVTISQENNVLDIAVSFPVGETHYMLVRGLRPFVKLQLYGIDYRTDPQFERYDSSGWSFSSSEQTLLLKLKHRSPVEHIKMFY